MALTYDNQFSVTNVYGRAVQLLSQIAKINDKDAIHLDVGCGFGPIADSIKFLGLHYVGVDIDEDGLSRLRANGYEAHNVMLGDVAATYDALKAVIGDRKLASITILDTLEHVPSPLDVLTALRRLASAQNAPIVLSVPNVTHTEIASRMVTGKFEYTLDGILDHTHIIHFSQETLQRIAQQAGLIQVDAADTKVVEVYRNLHGNKDALATTSAYYQLISHIRATADDTATSYQLVRAFLPGPDHDDKTWYSHWSNQPERPFLSIVMRTTGVDTHTLCDTLACLAGQRDQHFELLLLGHNLSVEKQIAVEQVLLNQPDFLRNKIRFERIEGGGRSRPLNVGYKLAQGQYIVTLDDDDLIFGNYVETFHRLHETMPGQLLRARCVVQSARSSQVDGAKRKGAISTSKLETVYPAEFDLLAHLNDNHTPCMSVAYPRELIHVFGLEFDESLTTAEDWDFMMRSYFLLGMATSPDITSIYRRWSDKMTSGKMHTPDEWQANRLTIIQKHNQLPVILSAGTLRQLRQFATASAITGQSPHGAAAIRLRTRIKQKIKRVIRNAVNFRQR